MSDFLTLNAEKRDQTGKGAARRLRATGKIPAVFYNTKGESTPIQVNEKELLKVFSKVKRTSVFNLQIDSSTYPALIWDMDYYPNKNKIQHVDVFGIDLNKEIKIHIPLEFVGMAKGAKVGGKLEVYHEVITVTGKPLSLPQKIEIDISNLEINQSIRIEDLKLNDGVTAGHDAGIVIASVVLGRGTTEEQQEEPS